MRIIFILFILFYAYAVVRYHLGKQLNSDYFLFVFNKAIAWSAAAFLGLSLMNFSKKLPSRKLFGLSAFGFGIIHIALSLYLGLHSNFPELYIQNSLSEKGVLVLVSGLSSIAIMTFPFLTSIWPDKFPQKWFHYGKWALLINLFHPLIIGFSNWWTPLKWPYFLPPITLLIVLMNGILFSIYWNKKRRVD